MRQTELAFLVLLGMLTTSIMCVDRAEAAALRHRVLPIILSNQPSAALSADGRWLAFFDVRRGRDVAVFYSLATSRSWEVDLEKHTDDWPGYGMDESPTLVWCPNRSVCAVLTERGWALAAPDRKRIQRLPKTTADAGTVSWSPRSGRLALFGLGGLFQLWDGRRLRRGPDWMETLRIPEYAVERTWQSEWSPDGRRVFLRFYGHADRDSTSPGHVLLLRPNTSQPHYRLTEEAGPTHWLDAHRLVFMGDDYIGAGPAPLKVSFPQTETSSIWLKDVANWTLSPRRDTLWALTGKGVLYCTPARRRNWRRVGRFAGAALAVSPNGDWLAISNTQYASDTSPLTLISTTERGPSRKHLRVLDKVVLLGWPAGQEFPLVARPWQKGRWHVWQIQTISEHGSMRKHSLQRRLISSLNSSNRAGSELTLLQDASVEGSHGTIIISPKTETLLTQQVSSVGQETDTLADTLLQDVLLEAAHDFEECCAAVSEALAGDPADDQGALR